MLAVPLFLVPAAALAFWPAPKWGAPMRATALVLLVALFGLALAERTPNGQLWRGLVLLLLIAAWLWLPRLRARDAAAAGDGAGRRRRAGAAGRGQARRAPAAGSTTATGASCRPRAA